MVLIFSHHDDNAISFNPGTDDIYPGFSRRFFVPSVAILNACSTANPGAFNFVNRFNDQGVYTVIASSTEIHPIIGGTFIKILADKLGQHAGDNSYKLDHAMFDTLLQLSQEFDEEYIPPQRYGARVLVFSLLGNGNLKICVPEKD